MSSTKQKFGPVEVVIYALVTLAGVLSLFPLYWLFVTSLSPQQFIVKVPPDLLPTDITLQNYQRLFSTTPVVRWLFNTLLIAGVITIFHLLFDSMAGYAFAKRRFPGRDVPVLAGVVHAHGAGPGHAHSRLFHSQGPGPAG